MDSYFKNTKRKSLFARVTWFLFICLMLGVSAALILSYFSTILNPYRFWFTAFFGLVAPLLMLANLLFLLILGLKLSKWALIPLATFILGVGYIGNFVQFRFVTEYAHDTEKKAKNEFTILTYNVHSFSHYDDSKRVTINEIINFIEREDPDIVCIQEFQLRNDSDQKTFEEKLGQKWKYQTVSSVIDKGSYKWGLAILSKLPLANANQIKFQNRSNSSMYVDVMFKDDTVRLFNSHLQSTQFNKLNRKKMQSGDPEDAARLIGSTLHQNYKIRAMQADTISAIMERSPYPIVAVGDFNDTPMSYVYHTIRGDMKDSFRERGEGYEYTYIPLKKIFRIDYILHSERLESLTYDSPLVTWSDHKPVIARLKLNKK